MATDKISSNDFLRHGEAVALGIICELSLSKLEAKNKRQQGASDMFEVSERLSAVV